MVFSAHAAILPYMDGANLYNLIDFNTAPTFVEPPVAPFAKNTIAAMTVIPVYVCPSDFGNGGSTCLDELCWSVPAAGPTQHRDISAKAMA